METEKKSGPSCIVIFGGGFLVLCVLVVVYAALFIDRPTNTAQPAPTARPPQPVEAPPAEERDLMAEFLEIDSLKGALVLSKMEMGESHNEMSPGTIALAIWSLRHLKWADIQELPSTKYGLVMKDSMQELGKKLCVRGEILEIQADRSEYGVGYVGALMAGRNFDLIRFYAVGSTGELVAGSRANFCGIITGRQSYDNVGGGTTIAASAVGMFKLPENMNR